MTADKDRRLGERHVLGPVSVRWRLDGFTVEPETLLEGPHRAGLLDLSASGALVMARTTDDLDVGDWLTISIQGATGPVVVRRIANASIRGFSQYGVEFLDPLSELTQVVHAILARRRPFLGTVPSATPDQPDGAA